MRPANTTSTINIWKSPIPYLFGSLGLVLMLISIALVLLACSYKKRSSSNSQTDLGGAHEKPPAMLLKVLDPEPKIVVIMAGDDKPTYLATPAISSSTSCGCCEQV